MIDFRNTKQIFYDGSEIQSVYYMGEKLWEKAHGNDRELLFEGRVSSYGTTLTTTASQYTKIIALDTHREVESEFLVSDIKNKDQSFGDLTLRFWSPDEIFVFGRSSVDYKFYGVK